MALLYNLLLQDKSVLCDFFDATIANYDERREAHKMNDHEKYWSSHPDPLEKQVCPHYHLKHPQTRSSAL